MSVIDVREVLETARRVIGNVTLGISVVGGVVVFTGVLILVGAVAMTKFRRIHEAAVLKTLGASSRLVGSMLLIEYGLLGLLAGLVGAVAGAVLGWGLSRWVIHVPWHAPVADSVAGIAATTATPALWMLRRSHGVVAYALSDLQPCSPASRPSRGPSGR